jgi:hypothetical protein
VVFREVSIACYGLRACAAVSCSICLDLTALFGPSERRSTLQPLRHNPWTVLSHLAEKLRKYGRPDEVTP